MGGSVSRLGWNVLLVALALIALGLYGTEQRKRGAAEALGDKRQAAIDSLMKESARVDTIYRADTVRLWRTLAHYDSVRVIDTLVRNDTVFVPRAVADAAVLACRATVLTCEERVRLRDQHIDSLEVEVRHANDMRDRPWTAAGLSYDPVRGKVGLSVDRDLSRLRFGATAGPGKAEIRASVRW